MSFSVLNRFAALTIREIELNEQLNSVILKLEELEGYRAAAGVNNEKKVTRDLKDMKKRVSDAETVLGQARRYQKEYDRLTKDVEESSKNK